MWNPYVMCDSIYQTGQVIDNIQCECRESLALSSRLCHRRSKTTSQPAYLPLCWPAHPPTHSPLCLLHRLDISVYCTLFCFTAELIHQIVAWALPGSSLASVTRIDGMRSECVRGKRKIFSNPFCFFSRSRRWCIFSASLMFLVNRTLPRKASLVVCHFILGGLVCFFHGWVEKEADPVTNC